MAITAQDVKALRERTGAGMMDCKRALTENDGDMDAAIRYLEEKGIANAKKKSGRVAAEGLVRVWANADSTEAVVVEVNSETDFVSRNEQFQEFTTQVTDAIGVSGITSNDEIGDVAVGSQTVAALTTETIAALGENLSAHRKILAKRGDGLGRPGRDGGGAHAVPPAATVRACAHRGAVRAGAGPPAPPTPAA